MEISQLPPCYKQQNKQGKQVNGVEKTYFPFLHLFCGLFLDLKSLHTNLALVSVSAPR